jgi:hypothetical protein
VERTLDSCKEIVAKAMEHGAWGWDDPDSVTDEMIRNAADELVGIASRASAKESVNDAVLEILHLANVEPVSAPSREAYLRLFPDAQLSANGSSTTVPQEAPAATAFGQPATAEPQSSAPSEPADSPAPAAEGPTAEQVNAIFGGMVYDDQKVNDIKAMVLASAASGDLSPEEWQQILAYESAHEERKTILSLQPEFKAPEPEPTISAGTSASAPAAAEAALSSSGEAPADDVSLEQVYHGEAVSLASQEGLPVPHDANPSVPPLPINITDVTDQQLSTLGSMYHSLFARAQWLISQEEGRAAPPAPRARAPARDAFVRAYELHKQQIPEEKRSQPTALEAARKQAEKDAELADPVRTWRSRKVHHNIEVRELKALATGYDKAVWRVDKELDRRSRLATTGRAAQ